MEDGTGMKAGTPQKTKFRALQQVLNARRYVVVGILELLWELTARDAPHGDIGRFTDEAIAEALDVEPALARRVVNALTATGWLDEHERYRLVVHDWPEHAPYFVHTSLARKAERFADGTMPALTRIPKDRRPGILKAFEEKGLVCERSSEALMSAHERYTKPSQAKPSLYHRSEVPDQGDKGVAGLEAVYRSLRDGGGVEQVRAVARACAEVDAGEAPGADVVTRWQVRVAEMARLGGLAAAVELLEAAVQRAGGDERVLASKGWTRLERPGAWLNAETGKWVAARAAGRTNGKARV
jgi:hypothetical protein